MVDRKLELVANDSRSAARISPRSLVDLSDDELMLFAVSDDAGRATGAFEVLVTRHQSVVLGYAARYLGEPASAREVTQEVFLTAWQDRGRYRPKGRFRSYLLTIALNRARAAAGRRKGARDKRAHIERAAAPADGPQLPLEALLEAERAARVRRELAGLDEKTRAALILRCCLGLSYDEISAVTGRRTGTLKSQVSRGLRRLHDQLAEEIAP